jgi:hypothetical protein
MEASFLKSKVGSGLVKWRLHTHFDVERYIPTRIDVTPNGGGPYDERAVLERTIEPDHLYVKDRGYAKFSLFNKIVAARSSYVCRLRDNSTYEVKVYSMDPPQLTMLIRKEHQHLVVTDADVRTVRDSLLESRSGPARRMMAISFEDRPPPPTTMPAYAPHVLTDEDHCLCVREYSRPGDPRLTWSVFSEDGVYLASANTPPSVRIVDVGSDYVLGLRHDEDEVEYVQMFRLIKGK